jgi:hypothetical protein
MSTRAQVFVAQSGLDWLQVVALYHHQDGYPTNMLPLIKLGRDIGIDALATYELGRAGKAASMICASDPTGFEVEVSLDIHSDIEWLYYVEVTNKEKIELSKWLVTVYRPKEDFYSLKREPRLTDLREIWTGTVEKAVKAAKKIEVME